jgi:hypothetical protein
MIFLPRCCNRTASPLGNPPRTMDELLVTLDDLGLAQTVAELRRVSR